MNQRRWNGFWCEFNWGDSHSNRENSGGRKEKVCSIQRPSGFLGTRMCHALCIWRTMKTATTCEWIFYLNYPFDEKYINFIIYQFAQVSFLIILLVLLISLEIFLPIFISMLCNVFSLSMESLYEPINQSFSNNNFPPQSPSISEPLSKLQTVQTTKRRYFH